MAADPLSPLSRRFVLHWGEMGSRWGVNRSVAQIHALLFLSGRPMHAEEIADILVRSGGIDIQKLRVNCACSGSTRCSSGSLSAKKPGNTPKPAPVRTAVYCAKILVLRKLKRCWLVKVSKNCSSLVKSWSST